MNKLTIIGLILLVVFCVYLYLNHYYGTKVSLEYFTGHGGHGGRGGHGGHSGSRYYRGGGGTRYVYTDSYPWSWSWNWLNPWYWFDYYPDTYSPYYPYSNPYVRFY